MIVPGVPEPLVAADVHSLATVKNLGKSKDLLQALVPRAQCFRFYDQYRKCVWSSDGADDYEIDVYLAEIPGELLDGCAPEAEYLRRTLQSGRTLLVLPVDAKAKAKAIGS